MECTITVSPSRTKLTNAASCGRWASLSLVKVLRQQATDDRVAAVAISEAESVAGVGAYEGFLEELFDLLTKIPE
jgi:hypothetical protein